MPQKSAYFTNEKSCGIIESRKEIQRWNLPKKQINQSFSGGIYHE